MRKIICELVLGWSCTGLSFALDFWLDLFLLGFQKIGGYLVTVYINNFNLGGGRNQIWLSLMKKHWLLTLTLKGECGGIVSLFLSCSISVTK